MLALLAGLGLLGFSVLKSRAQAQEDVLLYLPMVLHSGPSSTLTPTPTDIPGVGLIIDHRHTNAGDIPLADLDTARQLDIFFAHQSIGYNILDGMEDLASQDARRYAIDIYYGGASWFASNDGIVHLKAGPNLYPLEKITNFDDQVRNQGFDVADVAMVKLCSGDVPPFSETSAAASWAAYRNTIEALELDYPEVTFVWWTLPLFADWDSRGSDERAEFNGYMRDYCRTHNVICFDIADIESNGGIVTDAIGNEAANPAYTYDKTHLNSIGRQRVAHAMWYLLVQTAE